MKVCVEMAHNLSYSGDTWSRFTKTLRQSIVVLVKVIFYFTYANNFCKKNTKKNLNLFNIHEF